ncbi:hypothetical protein GC170_19605 [bacterium]|nr:hypothetical protein [bacterium]
MSSRMVHRAAFAFGSIAFLSACIVHAEARPIEAAASNVDPDTLHFLYRTPFASSGLVEVYLGMGGKYVRTTPFRLARYELQGDGKLLTIHLNVDLSEKDERAIESQMEQSIPKVHGAPSAVKAKNLIWMTPFTVTVEVRDPLGNKVGESTQQNVTQGQGGVRKAISIDPESGMSFPVSLPSAVKPEEIGRYRVVVKSSYVVKTAQAQTAAFEATVSDGMTVLERILGGKPNANEKLQPGDLVTRDASRELPGITKLQTYGTTQLSFQTQETELRSATAVIDDIAELRGRLAALSARLDAAEAANRATDDIARKAARDGEDFRKLINERNGSQTEKPEKIQRKVVSYRIDDPERNTFYDVLRADVHGAGLIVIKASGEEPYVRVTRLGYLVGGTFTQLGQDAIFAGVSPGLRSFVGHDVFKVGVSIDGVKDITVFGFGDMWWETGSGNARRSDEDKALLQLLYPRDSLYFFGNVKNGQILAFKGSIGSRFPMGAVSFGDKTPDYFTVGDQPGPDGFWLSVHPDYKARTFYVGKVVNGKSTLYECKNGAAKAMKENYEIGEGPGTLVNMDPANGFWIKAL